jgi:hypothetical protein
MTSIRRPTSPSAPNIHHPIPGPPSRAAGPPLAVDGKALVSALNVLRKPARMTREPTFVLHPQHELTTSEKGGADAMFGTL